MDDEGAGAISTYTLYSGSEGEEIVVVQNSTCYSMYVEALGAYGSEVSWEICGIEGGIETTAYFCIDDVGSCSEYVHDCDLKMDMYDSWGDGWNGNTISLYDDSDEVVQEVTLYGGFSGVECLDVEVGQCYSVKLSEEGSYAEEVTFSINGIVNDANYQSEVSFCVDNSTSPPEYSTGGNQYGVAFSMFDSWGDGWNGVHECNYNLTVHKFDSWGDGWNGNIISLYDDSDEAIQNVTLYGGFSGVECLDVELGQCYSLKLSEEGSWPEELTWAVEGVVYNATAESEVSFCTDESETAESSDEYSVEISMCLVVSTEDLSASACSSAVHSVITDFLYATDGLSGGETLILTMTAVDGDACSRRALKDAALSFKASSSTQKPSTTAGSAATEDDGTLAYDINIKIVVDSEAAAETFAEAFQDEVDEGALEDALAEEDLTVEQLSATATAKGTSGGASSSSDNDGDSSTTATLSSSDGETETSSSEDVDAVTTESEEDEETLAGDMAGAARLLLARRGAGVFLVALAAVVGVAVVLPF
uniref:Uncharacterized protein n=1 Tax=Heterosigma akashiwo TaxID=2829 RepID=A0A7S3Y1F5_HETAK